MTALPEGSQIRVVSPASPIDRDKCRAGQEFLESLGYDVTYGRHAFCSDGYLAGDDAGRASDLTEAFEDPDVGAVFCARGGYGCSRLLPYLNLDRMAGTRKLFFGFSDPSVFHLALNRRGLPTYYAPMLLTLSVDRPAWVFESLSRALRGKDPFDVDCTRAETLVGGSAIGESIGGCMCLLTDSIGTPDELQTEGKILFLEDVDENPHRIDAMLTHLRLAGKLQACAGIVVGEMTRTDEKPDPSIGTWPWRRIVEDRLEGLNVPTVVGFPFGHMDAMLTVPLGVQVELDADKGQVRMVASL